MKTILKAFKVRIYPNKSQKELIDKTLGCSRFIFNQMLAEKIQVYEEFKEDKEKLYNFKYKTEKEYKENFEFLREVDSMSLQQARIDLSNAYSNFFKSVSGKRKGLKVGFPKFKKKKGKSSYRTVQNIKVDFGTKKIKLPKLDWLSFRDKRVSFDGNIKSATVSRSSTGKYFVSVLFEQEIEDREKKILKSKDKILGLDMSLDKFFVDSNGESPDFEKLFRKSQKDLKKFQRRLSKKKLYSKNWYKSNFKVNLVSEKVANKRKDFTQKLSTKLVKEYDVIVIEDLNLKAMSQCLNLGKSTMDLGFGEFVKQLKYKAEWFSKTIVEADKWFPSSKLCNVCGYKYKDLQLSERSWTCPSCETFHDRDWNAGKNLKKFGLNILGLGQPNVKPVESRTPAFS